MPELPAFPRGLPSVPPSPSPPPALRAPPAQTGRVVTRGSWQRSLYPPVTGSLIPGSASECESPEHLTPFMPPGAEPGRMRWPGMSLWGVLWLWLPLASGHPVRLEKVRADTRNLTRTLSARIQQLQLFPLSLKISGLEAIPGEGAPEGLGAMDHRLQLFQRLLGGLAAGGLPLAQIANDMENLRSLLAALAAHLGCPLPRAPPAPPGLPDLLAEAPHTAAGLALARLRICLDSIAARLDSLPAC
ncbi:leptin isoform X2 [Falco cherrug]|uniref:leptin isoform X2 n=1 Tax=Falco cherrug TaxID=345164 RepID=UPI00247B1774|nr:leptin isoform X2 [Falco cherrug]